MKINIDNAGKRYGLEWVFRNVNLTIEQGESVAITGPNGSGKSTFLKLISGGLLLTSGKVQYSDNGQLIAEEEGWKYISFAAPYIELVEDFTLQEHIDFHFSFKKMITGVSKSEIIELSKLSGKNDIWIRHFSSGMKQRLKLALAFFTDNPIILLDEPTSNLDAQGAKWYQTLVRDYRQNRTLLVGSNQEAEYAFCEKRINILDHK